MKAIMTNTNGETIDFEVPELEEGVATSGYIDVYNEEELDSPETLEAVESMITSQMEENSMPPMNRAQRRAFMKKFGKTGETISEAIKKFAYVDLIQRLRELNEKKENENYETTTKNS